MEEEEGTSPVWLGFSDDERAKDTHSCTDKVLAAGWAHLHRAPLAPRLPPHEPLFHPQHVPPPRATGHVSSARQHPRT